MKFIYDTDRILITENWKQISPKGMQLVERFYYLLFEKYPNLQALFTNSPYRQSVKFKDMMDVMVQELEEPTRLITILKESGERHVSYGVKDEYYQPVGSVLLQAIREASGSGWNMELDEAWNRLLTNVVNTMTDH